MTAGRRAGDASAAVPGSARRRHLVRRRADVAGLRGSLSSVDELDAYWRERFPAAPDRRALRDTESMPLLVEVGHVSREIRGEHLVRALVDLAARGEDVLAVGGASHVRVSTLRRTW